jgi:hypothetical protein
MSGQGPDSPQILTGLRKEKSNAGLFVLALLAGILGIAYLLHAGEPARLDRSIKTREAKLLSTKKYLAENYDALIGGKTQTSKQSLPDGKPLLTIIKESAAGVGLTDNLSAVIPEENRKLGEVTAKVVLRRIRLADLVNFLVYVRSKYPGVIDRQGQLRLARRQQADNWDAFVSLTTKSR